jgi:UDP-glucose 4-epimerase
MSRYLITGGLGFIGAALGKSLTAAGHQVRIIDNLSSGQRDCATPDCELLVGDVGDNQLVREAMTGVDGCFHLATSSETATQQDDDIGCNNLPGMINVLSAARDAGARQPVPVVYASSSITYGDNAHTSLHEDLAARPLTSAAADKAAIEMRASVAALAHGIPTTGLRLFSVYGSALHSQARSSGGVVASFLDNILAGRGITIYGDGHQTRDFVYLADAVKFFITAMALPSAQPSVYNVCTGRQTSIRQLADMLCSLCGKSVEITRAPARRGDIRTSVGNPEQAIRHLGLRAGTSLADGLAQMLAQHPAGHTFGRPTPLNTDTLAHTVLGNTAVSS